MDSRGQAAARDMPLRSESEGKQLLNHPQTLDTIMVLINMVTGGQSTIC